MIYDFAILYWGMTRSAKRTFLSQAKNIDYILDNNNLTYKKFLHTWVTTDNRQMVWGWYSEDTIDDKEYRFLNPDFVKVDNQDDFLANIDMTKYYYEDVAKQYGAHAMRPPQQPGEWRFDLVRNHVCALESMKRCLGLLEEFQKEGHSFRFIMFLRPDAMVHTILPLHQILAHENKIHIPFWGHYGGLNDRFAIMNYKNACLYAKRIDELEEYRKTHNRIVSEEYNKFIINKYAMDVNLIQFQFDLER
jgi:hypothetical protein